MTPRALVRRRGYHYARFPRVLSPELAMPEEHYANVAYVYFGYGFCYGRGAKAFV